MRRVGCVLGLWCLALAGCKSPLDNIDIKDVYGPAGRQAKNKVEQAKREAEGSSAVGVDEFDAARLENFRNLFDVADFVVDDGRRVREFGLIRNTEHDAHIAALEERHLRRRREEERDSEHVAIERHPLVEVGNRDQHLLLSDIVLAQGVLDQFGSLANVQLAHHICTMTLNRPDADAQQVADFFVGFSFCNEFQNLPLPDSQGFGHVEIVFPAPQGRTITPEPPLTSPPAWKASTAPRW